MANFKILRTIWLNNRVWKTGSEDALAAAGFTKEQQRDQLKREAIVYLGPDGKPVAKASQAADPDKSLEDYTVAELKDIAESREIDLEGASKKAEIIAAIESAE